jgi:hypothetical protein
LDFIKIVYWRGLENWGDPSTLRIAAGAESLPQERASFWVARGLSWV